MSSPPSGGSPGIVRLEDRLVAARPRYVAK